MKSLCFVVPVHGRLELTAICLRQLRRTCDALLEHGIQAAAIAVSDADTLNELDLDELGFGWVIRDNQFTSRRFNDGIQLATDPKFNPAPADFVVPFGSDDWADYRLFMEPLPKPNQIVGFQRMSFVREDGRELATTFLQVQGGSGIRIIPRQLVAPLGYRPAEEDRVNGCDTSILSSLRRHHGSEVEVCHQHLHDYQIVDWKTSDEQLTTYKNVTAFRAPRFAPDPFAALAPFYDADALDEMREFYAVEDALVEVAR